MDSFIRSKYESRRWAKEGAPPDDPSTLDDGNDITQQSSQPQPSQSPPSTQTPPPRASSQQNSANVNIASRQPQTRQLLSTGHLNNPSRSANQVPAPAQVQSPAMPPVAPAQNELFSLDFYAPAPNTTVPTAQQQQQPVKDRKQDIMSLFSAAPATAPAQQNAFGQSGGLPSAWDQQAGGAAAVAQGMMGNAGVGMWGASSGWAPPAAVVPPAQANVWGATASQPAPQTMQPNLFASGNDIWGKSGATTTPGSQDPFGSFASVPPPSQGNQRKDDAFGDIWGDFK